MDVEVEIAKWQEGVYLRKIRSKKPEVLSKFVCLSKDRKKLLYANSKTNYAIKKTTVPLESVSDFIEGQGTAAFESLEGAESQHAHLSFSLVFNEVESSLSSMMGRKAREAQEKSMDIICEDLAQRRMCMSVLSHLLGREPRKATSSGGVFGSSLDRDSGVCPYIVATLSNYLEKYALQSTGIFRLSGNADEIKYLKTLFTEEPEVDLEKSTEDVDAVAGLLKLWLRELPEPLLTHEFYDLFVAVQGIPDQEVRLQRVAKLLDLLPPTYVTVLDRLIGLCFKISQYEYTNKMGASNLAVVMTPNILRSDNDDVQILVEDMPLATALVETLITYYETVFQGHSAQPDPVQSSQLEQGSETVPLQSEYQQSPDPQDYEAEYSPQYGAYDNAQQPEDPSQPQYESYDQGQDYDQTQEGQYTTQDPSQQYDYQTQEGQYTTEDPSQQYDYQTQEGQYTEDPSQQYDYQTQEGQYSTQDPSQQYDYQTQEGQYTTQDPSQQYYDQTQGQGDYSSQQYEQEKVTTEQSTEQSLPQQFQGLDVEESGMDRASKRQAHNWSGAPPALPPPRKSDRKIQDT